MDWTGEGAGQRSEISAKDGLTESVQNVLTKE